jgi:hypothetical protein
MTTYITAVVVLAQPTVVQVSHTHTHTHTHKSLRGQECQIEQNMCCQQVVKHYNDLYVCKVDVLRYMLYLY